MLLISMIICYRQFTSSLTWHFTYIINYFISMKVLETYNNIGNVTVECLFYNKCQKFKSTICFRGKNYSWNIKFSSYSSQSNGKKMCDFLFFIKLLLRQSWIFEFQFSFFSLGFYWIFNKFLPNGSFYWE